MTKQEKIKGELKKYLRPNLKYEEESLVDGVVGSALWVLHTRDVVIKVERELPEQNKKCLLWDLYQKGWLESQQSMRLAGYVAVEELIKEEESEQ